MSEVDIDRFCPPTGHPLGIDLLDGVINPAWGIDNTIGGWTPGSKRLLRLKIMGLMPRDDLRRELYAEGYGLTEITLLEGDGFSREEIRITIEGVQRPPKIVAIRTAFPPQGGVWRLETGIGVMRDYAVGLSFAEIASRTALNEDTIKRRLMILEDAGLPLRQDPPVELQPGDEIHGWRELAGPNWESLGTTVKKINGTGLTSLGFLYQEAREEGIEVYTRSRHGVRYFYIRSDDHEKERLAQLREQRPEIFISPHIARKPSSKKGSESPEVLERKADSVHQIPNIDSLLARRVLISIIEGNIEPGNSTVFYQYFRSGLSMLEAEACDPEIRSNWDEETEDLWERTIKRMMKYGNKALFLRRIKEQLEGLDKNYFSFLNGKSG